MRHLVIGIPARNEAETIVELADALERGAALLGEVATAELVLAYQDSDDDTLERFVTRRHAIPQHVVRSELGTAGKGRNVKLLLEHAIAKHADLLLVDGDMRECEPVDVSRFVARGFDTAADTVLPLWCRPWGHANVTNYLAVPLLQALYGAGVRQPLAGQRFISNAMLQQLELRDLPDDYGIDVAITMAVLDHGGSVRQAVVPKIDHDTRQLLTASIMVDVATTLLERVAVGPTHDRSDVHVAFEDVRALEWPDDGCAGEESVGASDGLRSVWLAQLTDAVRAAEAGRQPRMLASALVGPFVEHLELRRREPRPEIADAEAYVWDLGRDLATQLS